MNCIWIVLLLLCIGNQCGNAKDYDDDRDCRRRGGRGGMTCDRVLGGREENGRNRRDQDDEDFGRPRRRHPFDDQDDSCPCTREYDYYQAENRTDQDDEKKEKEKDE